MTTPPTTSTDMIRYDLLVQDALKGVVRKVLIDAGKDGLPGEHHFYVSFRTDFPGVRLSQRMREKYPEEMTIVLQHQFWDLGVTEHAFEVGLSFSGVPERLLIPFDAVVGFFDPSVQFGLKFELHGEADAPAASDASARPAIRSVKPDEMAPVMDTPPALPKPKVLRDPAAKENIAKQPGTKEAGTKEPVAKEPASASASPDGAADTGQTPAAAQVVSLDAFRKKT